MRQTEPGVNREEQGNARAMDAARVSRFPLRVSPMRPWLVGGLLGAGLVAALYFADGVLRASGGGGMPLAVVAVMLGPGALAAWVAWRRGRSDEIEGAGALAGLATACFASALLVTALVVGALNIDWAAYEREVGAQIASEVREAAAPAVAVAAVAAVAVIFAGCVALGWLGALLFKRLLRIN